MEEVIPKIIADEIFSTEKDVMNSEDIFHQRMVAIFNEWKRLYDLDPAGFELKEGSSYGECCANHFVTIATRLESENKLST